MNLDSRMNISGIIAISDADSKITSTEHLSVGNGTSTNSNVTMEPADHRSTGELIWTSILLLLIILITWLGNLAVIFAIYNSPRLREQTSNLFIVNLSITDLSNGTVVMPTAFFALVLDVKHVNVVWCNIVCAANYTFIIVSMLTLAFISVERYIAIVHTFKHNALVTRNSIKVVIGYVWFQGFAFALPPVILHWIHYDYWEVICAIDWQYEKKQAVYYVITARVDCFLLPAFIMLFCYTNIIRHARKVAQSIPTMGQTSVPQSNDTNNPSNPQVQKASKSASKTIRSLLVVVVLFFICMTPFCVTKFLKVIFSDASQVPGYANLVSSYFQYMSSMVNPFIYAIFRPDFRNAYHLVWYRLMSKFCMMERPNLYTSTTMPQVPMPMEHVFKELKEHSSQQHVKNIPHDKTNDQNVPHKLNESATKPKGDSYTLPGKISSSQG